eukprot:811852_1
MGNQESHKDNTASTPHLEVDVHSPPISEDFTFNKRPSHSPLSDIDEDTPTARPSVTLTARLSSRFANTQILIPAIPETPSVKVNQMTPQRSFPSSISPSTPVNKPQLRPNKQSSFANVSNGITGTHIASRIAKIAAKFWYKNVERLDMEKRLEIGCSIFFGAFSTNKQMRHIMNKQFKSRDKTMEQKCLKYLDMIGWLLRNLLRDDIDLDSLLTKLGTVHQNMGVTIQHFDCMLQAMHESFSYYFPQQYNLEVKYAMDEIFTVTAQLMSGQDLSYSSYLRMITQSFRNGNDVDFLKTLRICIQSETGKEYFFQYLKQTFCDEIVLFLQTLSEFKGSGTPIQRFMIARDLIRTSIHPDANFAVNISFENRRNAMLGIEQFEREYRTKQPITMDSEYFADVEDEIYQLMLMNHWAIFKNNMKILQSKSFGITL